MIMLLGDIHGETMALRDAVDKAVKTNATAIIQLVDFGMFSYNEKSFYVIAEQSPIPIYFIDGNHDDCIRWNQYSDITRLWDGLDMFYIPRGCVFELDGRTFAAMGGAASIDKNTRLMYNWHWDEYENISPEETLRLRENMEGKQIDILLTHCPPNSVIEKHFDPRQKLMFGVGLDWHDHNQDVIQHIWDSLDNIPIYSGHMHRSIIAPNYRIVDINETVMV